MKTWILIAYFVIRVPKHESVMRYAYPGTDNFYNVIDSYSLKDESFTDVLHRMAMGL